LRQRLVFEVNNKLNQQGGTVEGFEKHLEQYVARVSQLVTGEECKAEVARLEADRAETKRRIEAIGQTLASARATAAGIQRQDLRRAAEVLGPVAEEVVEAVDETGLATERRTLEARLVLTERAAGFALGRAEELWAEANRPAFREAWSRWLAAYGELVRVSVDLERMHGDALLNAGHRLPPAVELNRYSLDAARYIQERVLEAYGVTDPELGRLLSLHAQEVERARLSEQERVERIRRDRKAAART
jgi:hypothetical protein